jgi:hypothetical protein
VVDSRRAQRLENWGWEEATGLSLRVRKSERQDSHCLRAEDGCYSSRRERERETERERLPFPLSFCSTLAFSRLDGAYSHSERTSLLCLSSQMLMPSRVTSASHSEIVCHQLSGHPSVHSS